MSQDAHSLLLFFDDESRHKQCLLMLLKLHKQEDEEASRWSAALGVDIRTDWQDHWFNHELSAQPEYIRIDYETSTHYGLPLHALQQLFACGMTAAVVDTFHDQVGECSRHYFLQGQLVDENTLFEACPATRTVVEAQFDDDLENESEPVRPVDIAALIKQTRQQQDDAQEMVGSLLELSKIARESGQNPMDVMRSALVLRALVKGVVQGVLFGVVTVLLFKGMWLWVGLSVLLVVILPLYHVTQASKEFDDEERADAD